VPPSEARANKTSTRKQRSESKRPAVETAREATRKAAETAKEAKRAELDRKQREAEKRREKKKREDAAKRTAMKNKSVVAVAETTAPMGKKIQFSSKIQTVAAGEIGVNSELDTATENETFDTSGEMREHEDLHLEDDLTRELLYIPNPSVTTSRAKVEAPREAPLSKMSPSNRATLSPALFTEVEAPREAPSSEKPVIMAQPTVLTEVPPNFKKRPSSTSRSGITISKKVKLPTVKIV